MPLLERGARSPAATRRAPCSIARVKAGARAQLLERDITRLGTLGEFDVVLCVNDVVNYVLDRDGVRRVLSGAAANLAPGGALVFDANTLRTFRVTFATSHVRVRRGLTFRWRGRATPGFAAGDVARADLDVARGWARRGAAARRASTCNATTRTTSWSTPSRAAGLRLARVYGQYADGRRDSDLDDARHLKAVYVATLPSSEKGGDMSVKKLQGRRLPSLSTTKVG